MEDQSKNNTIKNKPLLNTKNELSNNKHRLKEIPVVSEILQRLSLTKSSDSELIFPNKSLPTYTNATNETNNESGVYFTQSAIKDLQFIYHLYQKQPEVLKLVKDELLENKNKLEQKLKKLTDKENSIIQYKKKYKQLPNGGAVQITEIRKNINNTKKDLENLDKKINNLTLKPFNYLCLGRKDLLTENIIIEKINLPGFNYYLRQNKYKFKDYEDTIPSKEYEKNLINNSYYDLLSRDNPDDLIMEDYFLKNATSNYFYDEEEFKQSPTAKVALVGTTANQGKFNGFTLNDMSKNIFKSNTHLPYNTYEIITGAIYLDGLQKPNQHKKYIPTNVECVILPYKSQRSGPMSTKTFKLGSQAYNVKKSGIVDIFPSLIKKATLLKTIPCNNIPDFSKDKDKPL